MEMLSLVASKRERRLNMVVVFPAPRTRTRPEWRSVMDWARERSSPERPRVERFLVRRD